jgi:septum formation protein
MDSPTRTRALVLASASVRRRVLLESLGLDLVVDPAHVDEALRDREPPADYVMRLARAKAEAVAVRHPGAVVLGADTSVVLDGTIFGKPTSAEHALWMLSSLAGRTHSVVTAVAVAGGGAQLVRAEVTFAVSSDAALRWYVATGEPMDKAGAYAVQGIGGFLIERIDGSHSAVIGLPLVETVALLRQADYCLPWEQR